MNTKKRVNSIARRLQWSWQRKKLSLMISLDVCALLLCFAAFLYAGETAVTGSFQGWNAKRWFIADTELKGFSFLMSVQYRFVWQGENFSLPLAPFVSCVRLFGGILCAMEALSWLAGFLRRSKEIRRILKPLDDLAEAAQKLSARAAQSAPAGEEKLHDLQNAISRLNVGDTLSTGDRELAGIEQAVNDMIARLQAAYRQQAQFVSDASHELRTPIAVIRGYANMLDRWGKTDEKVLEESIEAIKTETEHMKTLVEQLLFLARGDNGRLSFEPAQTDLAEMIKETLEEYRMIDAAHVWTEGELSAAPVLADPALIKQTARILADNAKRYTPEGEEIRLSAGILDGACYYQVQDAGCGIAPGDVTHIFDRFFRADSARDRATGGTGLGLAIAKQIVEKHGGWFTVTSRPGIGTRIRVWLPKAPADVARE